MPRMSATSPWPLAQVPEAGQRPEDKESKADEDAARGDEANGPADLVAETLRARRQPERGDRGPAGSGKAVEGRPAGGWTHHGGSPHVAIPLSRGRRPGQIGSAHVRTTVTNEHIVCRLLLEKKYKHKPT